MNVVILTPVPFWHPGTQELVDGLKSSGIKVRALDIFHGRMIDCEGVQRECKPTFASGFLGKIYLRLFRNQIIDKQINEGDIVDIHFLEPAYGRYIETISSKKIKLITSLFGSDLYRTDDAQKKAQLPVFEKSEFIILSENMIPYFEKHFPTFENKYRINQYGSARLDLIDDLNTAVNKKRFREKYAIPDEKLVVSCGYNGKKEQQHIKLLDEIDLLDRLDKEKLFLVFLMTYGREDAEYIELVKKKVSDLNIPHLYLEERLTDTEIAEIRVVSDITINTQTTDALATPIKEAMAAGDIMLIGDWLPYEIYKNLGIYYLAEPMEKISERLKHILNNMDDYREKSKVNKEIILKFASWKVLLKDWIRIYQEVNAK